MKLKALATWAAVAVSAAVMATAEPLRLKPASPQPGAGSLKPGLAVRYAYPADVKYLDQAERALKNGAEPGPPLKGLDYADTREGQKTLTSRKAWKVVADISGYVKFDAPGIYEIDFLTNDGIRAVIGGQLVGLFDGRQPCDSTFVTEVDAPKAGWYKLDILYFQRQGTSCLHMRRGLKGKRVTWVPDTAFGH